MIYIVILTLIILIDYSRFIKKRQHEISSFKSVSTSYGDVTYVDYGTENKNVILFCTGGGVAIDSVYLFDWLVAHGYRLICINRPGYLNLPLTNSFKDHALIYHEVLTKLNITDVSVFGVSMGAVSALEYTLRFNPKCLLLWSGVTTAYTPNQEAVDSALGKLILGSRCKNIISYLFKRSAWLFPTLTCNTFLAEGAHLDASTTKKIASNIVTDATTKAEFLKFVNAMTPMQSIYAGMMEEVKMSMSLDASHWSNITAPCLAIHSEVDKDVSLDHLTQLKQVLPHLLTLTVKAAGHYIWWGPDSDKVKSESVNFLNTHQF